MKDSKFRQFIKKELQREAQDELAKVQANEKIRDLKMSEDVKEQILESILREIDEREKKK